MINGVAFEVRANVAIRIIVEGVELEPHPLLTMDANGTRRKAWQSIASAALQEFAPPSPRLTPSRDANEQAERRRARQRAAYRKKREQETAATKGHVINAADAIRSQLARGTRQSPAFKPSACIHCGREFIKAGPRQVYCKRKPCVRFKAAQQRKKDHARRALASSTQENA